ncbi:glycosyltransferase [Sphingomonas sp.]|uniref:glycosyltransferase family 4 protein n=1 Tax=Sphingomonas sp. TaxID=28214 RepID=UPI002D8040BD|nr:glycosyltransferase [Sphingomonas sp.]HEU0044528.1 glycosyltransferase [Sphingomonas sp.]
MLCPFPVGVAAGQRLKYEQYVDDWRAAGWDVTLSPFMDLALWDVVYQPGHLVAKVTGTIKGVLRRWRDIFRVRRYDAVYVYIHVSPIGTTLLERLVRRLAKRLVYDIEDNILDRPGAGPSINPITRMVRSPAKPRVLTVAADEVITASPFLVEPCRALNRHGRCTMIPPSVDTELFVPGRRDPARIPVIGWTGTFSSEPYLDLLRPVLQRLAREVDYKLRVIGNFDYALPGVDLEVVRWTRQNEVADMQAIDIGLYPLPDDDWIRGKAGLKVIQYMAFGIPSVSSNVGTAPLQVRHGETGFLADTDEDWFTMLAMLVRDPALRAQIGVAARTEAVRLYGRHAVAGQYRAVLDRVRAR